MKALISLALALAASTAAVAAPVTSNVTVDGFAYGSRSVEYDTNKADGLAAAGGFNITSGNQSFLAYCIELTQNTYFGAINTYTSLSPSSYFSSSKVSTDLGRLFGTFGSSINTTDESAAFQMAVWEIVYENGNGNNKYDVTKGSAQFNSFSAVETQANYYLSHLGNTSSSLTVFSNGKYQDLIAAVVPTSPVPEPSSIALIGAGLAALGFVARRKKAN